MIHLSTFQGLSTLLIDTPLARCEIALFGAQVLSFIPKADGRELLWCSASQLMPGKPVRGGIPLCWPWFAKQNVSATAAQHGFVRTLNWQLTSQSQLPSGEVELTFSPPSFPESGIDASSWPEDCRVEMQLKIGARLEQRLITSNQSSQTLLLTQALHSYFRVSDVRQVAVEGLQGHEYLDKLQDFAAAHQVDPWSFSQSCDRIYLDTQGQASIVDPIWQRRIIIDSCFSASTVVWNPGAIGVQSFTDIPASDWSQYLCVEVANCSPKDSISLPPGASCTLQQTLSVTAL